jgi:bis(5'-nucleosyl)-tetraphosphatase (symmetrical)
MAVYVMGDVQGCNDALARLLSKLGFNRGTDTVVLLGDLVNRGRDSLGVLRRVRSLGSAAELVLGNHDLHALAVHVGARQASVSDTLADLLAAPDATSLFGWLSEQPLALVRQGTLLVHAGVLPQWDVDQVLALNAQFMAGMATFARLGGDGFADWLRPLFGNLPLAWHAGLAEDDTLRLTINALTRLRFCTPEGAMEFASKGKLSDAPAGHVPWFECPNRATARTPMAFGHWSLLGLMRKPHLMALDTGCAWGGQLSAVELLPEGGFGEVVQVRA